MMKRVSTKKLPIQIKKNIGTEIIVLNQSDRLKDPDNHMHFILITQGHQNQCSTSIINNNACVTAGELSSNNKSAISKKVRITFTKHHCS